MNLFVNIDTFPEQIVIAEMFSKFRSFLDCACLLRVCSPRDIIKQLGIPFSYVPWNWIWGFSCLNIESIVRLVIWLLYTSNVGTRVSKHGTIPTILGKYAAYDDWFQNNLTFIGSNKCASPWENLFSVPTVFTLIIQTPDLFTVLVLKLELVYLTTYWSA